MIKNIALIFLIYFYLNVELAQQAGNFVKFSFLIHVYQSLLYFL